MILRLLATAALGADLWASLRIVQNEANPILRWLVTGNRIERRPDGSAYWKPWARTCWWGYWIAWVAVMWLAPWWQVPAAILVAEVCVVAWNLYCWMRRRQRNGNH